MVDSGAASWRPKRGSYRGAKLTHNGIHIIEDSDLEEMTHEETIVKLTNIDSV
jgi:hypothetical protein